jgi:DNA-binding CsgD family transcriptional regulator
MRSGNSGNKHFLIVSALILLGLFPPALTATEQSMYGYGCFTVGIVILEMSVALERHRTAKLFLLAAYLFLGSFFAVGFTWAAFSRALFTALLVVGLRFAAWYMEKAARSAAKPRLSLHERGLSPAEAAYVRAAATGVSYKEIASDAKVSESTVRNTLARAYRKLGVADKAALVALIDAHDVEA